MFVVRHLQQQLSELQEQYSICSSKLQRLQNSYAIEIDSLSLFKLEYQIKEINAERERIAQKIEILETTDRASSLHKVLLKLNYHNQVHLFQNLMDISQVGAFLIHGEQDYGQSWLLNRLVGRVLQSTVGKVVPVDLGSRRRRDFDAIVRELCRCVDLKNTRPIQDVVERVHSWWQTQTVILIFHNVDAIDQKYMQDLMQKFWLPLVDKTIQKPSQTVSFKLLMFLVDDYGYIDEWPFDYVEQLNASWKPYTLIKPPRLTLIHTNELADWMRYEYESLPLKVRNTPVEDILRNCQEGIPQSVLEYICELYDCDWSELEMRWIIY